MIKGLKNLVRSVLGPSQEVVGLEREIYESSSDAETLRRRLELSERKNKEYFDLIEHVLKQRDERWEMFLEQSVHHQNAQVTLENQILVLRTMLGSAIREINDYRKRENLELIEKPADLADPPIGTAKEFEAFVKVLREKVSQSIDGIKERDQIAGVMPGVQVAVIPRATVRDKR